MIHQPDFLEFVGILVLTATSIGFLSLIALTFVAIWETKAAVLALARKYIPEEYPTDVE